jgi:hypothetical protein
MRFKDRIQELRGDFSVREIARMLTEESGEAVAASTVQHFITNVLKNANGATSVVTEIREAEPVPALAVHDRRFEDVYLRVRELERATDKATRLTQQTNRILKTCLVLLGVMAVLVLLGFNIRAGKGAQWGFVAGCVIAFLSMALLDIYDKRLDKWFWAAWDRLRERFKQEPTEWFIDYSKRP